MQHTNPDLHAANSMSHASVDWKAILRAAHEVLLACFLQSCSTRRWILCSAQNIARVLYTKVNYCVTHKFGLSHSTKIEEHTRVLAHECQLRRELYHSCPRGENPCLNVFFSFL